MIMGYSMGIDLTKIIQHSSFPAFANNNIYTGTLSISGSWARGLNTRTWNIALTKNPDLMDMYFIGPGADGRPSTAMFRSGQGRISVPTAGGTSIWDLSYTMTSPTNLQIRAYTTNQGTSAHAITSTSFTYRFVDYSAL